MKNPKEYLKELFEEPFNLEEGSIENDFLKIIKQVQIDTIEETCKKCAEEAKIINTSYKTATGCPTNISLVDKLRILKVADELKKELE